MDKLKKQMDFLMEIDKLKNIFRQYAPEGTDLLRAIKMMLVHDLVEIYAGDTYLYDVKGNETKAQRESEAAEKLYAILDKEVLTFEDW